MPRRRPGPRRETGSPTPPGPAGGSSSLPSHPTAPAPGKSRPRRTAIAKTRHFLPTAAPGFTHPGKGDILPSKSYQRTAGGNGSLFPASGMSVHPPGHPDGSLEGAHAPGFIHHKEGKRMKGSRFLKWAVLALSMAALVAVGCAKKQTVKSEGAQGAPGAAAPGAVGEAPVKEAPAPVVVAPATPPSAPGIAVTEEAKSMFDDVWFDFDKSEVKEDGR